MIQLSSLGQNQLPVPSFHCHDLNDRKQLELMERTGYEIVQRNGQRIYGGKIMVLNINLTSFAYFPLRNFTGFNKQSAQKPLQSKFSYFPPGPEALLTSIRLTTSMDDTITQILKFADLPCCFIYHNVLYWSNDLCIMHIPSAHPIQLKSGLA